MNQKVENLKGKLIVSCQALSNEPLHSSFIMGRMALAAKQGGILLCRLFVHYVEILVGSVKKGEQICRQLLD